MEVCARPACRTQNWHGGMIIHWASIYIMGLRELLCSASAMNTSDKAALMLNWSSKETEQSRSKSSGRAADWTHQSGAFKKRVFCPRQCLVLTPHFLLGKKYCRTHTCEWLNAHRGEHGCRRSQRHRNIHAGTPTSLWVRDNTLSLLHIWATYITKRRELCNTPNY